MIFEVGKQVENWKGHIECSQFDIDDNGAILLVYFNSPTEHEVKQFASENPFEIRILPLSHTIMVMAKVGSLNWMDMPYTPHLSQNLTKYPVPSEGMGLALSLVLIDSKTGIVKGFRLIGLSEHFSKKLCEEAKILESKPFDKGEYDVENDALFSKYRTNALVKMSSTYFKLRD